MSKLDDVFDRFVRGITVGVTDFEPCFKKENYDWLKAKLKQWAIGELPPVGDVLDCPSPSYYQGQKDYQEQTKQNITNS